MAGHTSERDCGASRQRFLANSFLTCRVPIVREAACQHRSGTDGEAGQPDTSSHANQCKQSGNGSSRVGTVSDSVPEAGKDESRATFISYPSNLHLVLRMSGS